MCFVVIFPACLESILTAVAEVVYRDRLSVGSLEDLTLGRVVPEQLLDQVDVSEQHAAAAVAGESQFVERLTVHGYHQRLIPDCFRRGIPRTLQSCPRHYRGQST